jgi:hypothetical protein
VYEFCDVCGDRIVRDLLMSASDTTAPYWLAVCGCPTRKWRWRSPIGESPWELIGSQVDGHHLG